MFEFHNNRIYFSTLIKSVSTLIKFAQSEKYSNIYIDRIMAEFVNFLNSSHPDHHGYFHYSARAQRCIEKVCFIIYALNFKDDFLIKHFKRTLQKDIDKKVFKINFIEAL